MSDEPELPTASVVGSSPATPARPPAVGTSAPMSGPQGPTYPSHFGVQTTGATSVSSWQARCNGFCGDRPQRASRLGKRIPTHPGPEAGDCTRANAV